MAQAPLTKILLLLEGLRKLDPEMPIQQAVAFLVIARQEGITQKKVAELAGMSKSAAQRAFDKLADRGVNDRPGLGLIEVRQGRLDRRETEAFLTPLGRQVLKSMVQIVGD